MERIESIIVDIEKSLFDLSVQVKNLNSSLKELEVKLFQMPVEKQLETVEVVSQEENSSLC